MISCPRCGTQNADNASFCGECGHAFAASGAPAAKTNLGKATMLGIALPLQPPSSSSPAPASMGKGKTIVGMALPPELISAPAPVSPVTAPDPKGKGKTIVGMAAPSEMMGMKVGGDAVNNAPAANDFKKTLLGVAPVVTQAAPSSTPTAMPFVHGKGKTMIGIPAASIPTTVGAIHSPRKTLMGAAFSSLIAPLSPIITEPEYVEEVYEEVVPETGEVQRRVRMVAKPLPPIYRRPAFYVLLGAPVLLLGGIAALFLLKRPSPILAEARLDSEGMDMIHISCESCPDGTKLTADGLNSAEVSKGKAELKVKGRLKVGDNAISLQIDRPEYQRDETVSLVVPVAYRFSPDLASLQDANPAILVNVEARPGAAITIQGKPLPLDASGKGSTRVDVQGELLALSSEQKVFSREIPYTIQLEKGALEAGKLSVRVGVVSLSIDSPGSNLVTDQATFLLAGHAPKGTALFVAGAPVSVGENGAFRQYLKIPGLGLAEVPLRASAKDMAPRLMAMRVKLVPSLVAEGKALDASGRPGYADVLAKLAESKGMEVAWHGKVLSTGNQGDRRIAVVDVQTGCKQKPCRARVAIPGGGPLSVGDRLAIYGRLLGIVSDQGIEFPDIEADFIVRQP